MSIAEFVTRRGLMLRYLVIAALAVAYGAMFVAPHYYGIVTKGKLVICLLPAVLLSWVFAKTTKCPRCRSSLGGSIITAATPFSSEIPDACPSCGLSFNEPMRPPTDAP